MPEPHVNRTGRDNMTFLPVSVPVPLVIPGAGIALQSGTNIIRDPASRDLYLITGAAGVSLTGLRTEFWVFRGALA